MAAAAGTKPRGLRGLEDLPFHFYIEGDEANPAINTPEALAHLQYHYAIGDAEYNAPAPAEH